MPDTPAHTPDLVPTREQIAALRLAALALAARHAFRLDSVHPRHRLSATNLLHYLAVRRHDLRTAQEPLARLGLSSLGRAEGHVLATLEAVLARLSELSGHPVPEPAAPLDHGRGAVLLEDNARRLLGPTRPERGVRIMVTLPGQAADDARLIDALLDAGMDCARINGAHDGPEVWARMVSNLRAVQGDRPCHLLVDLPGPKIRTGTITPGPEVVRIRPLRDACGSVVAPARVWLGSGPAPGSAATALPLERDVAAGWKAGMRLRLEELRGRRRKLTVVEVLGDGAWCELDRTAYVGSGAALRHQGRLVARVGRVPARPGEIHLSVGDRLVLAADPAPGVPARRDATGAVLAPARIGCTCPEAIAQVGHDARVWIDDGAIGGRVVAVRPGEIEIAIDQLSAERKRLRCDQGINLPETRLHLPPLSERDLELLPFVARHADLVGLSFLSCPEDVLALQDRLAQAGGGHVGLVLKVETRQAFDELPDLLLAGMRSADVGVMIARGDLAVEIGFERLAEVQEEILWLCEAAHLPVCWATQVLETLAKTGRPSRAEVSDAALAERAECVMLNKGPYVVEAVRFLDGVLRRMAAHQRKKVPMLRALGVAERFCARAEGADTPAD